MNVQTNYNNEHDKTIVENPINREKIFYIQYIKIKYLQNIAVGEQCIYCESS